jgi:hypothetical protein
MKVNIYYSFLDTLSIGLVAVTTYYSNDEWQFAINTKITAYICFVFSFAEIKSKVN